MLLFGHSLGASEFPFPLQLLPVPQEAASWTLKHWSSLHFHKGFSGLRKSVSSHWILMPEQSSLHQCLPIAVVNTAGKLLLLLFHLLNLVYRCIELDNPSPHLSSPCYEKGTPEGNLSGYQVPALDLNLPFWDFFHFLSSYLGTTWNSRLNWNKYPSPDQFKAMPLVKVFKKAQEHKPHWQMLPHHCISARISRCLQTIKALNYQAFG